MLVLTKDMLAASYDFLTTCAPFSKWNLPDSEEIEFHVANCPNNYGWYRYGRNCRKIYISKRKVTSTGMLMQTMAHEMVHVHEHRSGLKNTAEHSSAFHRWAAEIRKIHGFDI